MKNFKLYIILWAACFICFGTIVLAQKHPRELTEPKPLTFTPPKPVEFTLSNGIHVYYFEDRDLPLVSLTGMFPGGSLFDPPDKAGLASLTGTVLRTGGTKTITGDKIDEELEFLAASVEAFIGQENATVNANCLKKDFNRVLEIYADVIMNPEFRQEKIDLAKNQMKESIRRRWDMPASASNILFTEKLLGGTPYGNRSTNKTLNSITREDLIVFHQKYFSPNNMYLAVVGDLGQNEAQSMLENVFKGWAKKEVILPEVPALLEKADGAVYYAFKDTPQANMVIGHLGVRRNNPDESKIEVMNEIFGGGGFTPRLMKEIRSNRGLTYGIYGGVFSGRDRGVTRVASQLKADKFVEAMKVVKGIMSDLQNNPVSDEELDVAKKSLINSFVFNFESKSALATQYITLKLQGYPADYFDKYLDNIRKVTKADVQAVARKYMDPAKMIIVVVGDEKKFDQPLSTLGKVQPIDYKAMAEADRSEK